MACRPCGRSFLQAAGVLEFAASSNGDVAPLRDITGPRTQLTQSNGITWRGDIYVSQPNSVVVFRSDANGNAWPKNVIEGSQTFMNAPDGIAVDGNRIYVSSCGGGYIERFLKKEVGNEAPVGVISGRHSKIRTCVEGVAVGSKGRVYGVTLPSHVSILGFRATANGDARPVTRIAGPNTLLEFPPFIYVTGE
jgi:hypothetical protein